MWHSTARPPLFVAPSGHRPCDVHPKSKSEVCISCSRLVAGCHYFVAGIDLVALCCSSGPRLELVKSVKTKPPEVISLVLPPLWVVSWRHRRRARLATQCLGGTFFPSFKSRCMSSKKLEWCPPPRPLPVRQSARRLPICLGSLLPLDGCPRCHE
jgi:hypothetical protein